MQTVPLPLVFTDLNKTQPPDCCNSLRSLSMSVGLLPFHCGLTEVAGRLAEYFREKSSGGVLGDLESALFSLSKTAVDNEECWVRLSLQPLVRVHPLLDVAQCAGNIAESEVKVLLETEPEIVTQYQWTMRTIEWLGDLAVYWQLLTLSNFSHRYSLSPTSMVLSTQLSGCGRLDSLCFLPEVLCLSVLPGKLVNNQVKIWCVRVKLATEQLLTLLAHFQPQPEQSKVYEMTDFLNRDGRVSPEVSAKRVEVDRKWGVSLALPVWWRCQVWRGEGDRARDELYSGLKQMCKEYLQLECALAQLVCKS